MFTGCIFHSTVPTPYICDLPRVLSQLCNLYISKIKICILHLTQLFVYFIITPLLNTCYGLKRPSSGQNVQNRLKMQVHTVQKRQYYGIPFTLIISLYNYYQLLDVLFTVICVEIQ